MGKYRWLIWGCMLVLILACSERKRSKKVQITVQPSLIHPLFFQDEVSSLLNFPFWFNDSLLTQHKIKQLVVTSLRGVPSDTSATVPDSDVSFPKKTITYSFDPKGRLIHIQITNFSEGIVISNQSFQVLPTDELGYSKILLKENAYGVENNSPIYLILKSKPDYTALVSDDDEQMMHFIRNSQFFGPLRVDSLAHPLPNDWVILGTPERPVKRYKVLNKVKEKQISEYTYHNENYPAIVTSQEYPFFRKRYYHYDKGLFTGFKDSTYIDETFVTSVETGIHYNAEQLPVKIIHNKAHKDGVRNFETYETIDYFFYD